MSLPRFKRILASRAALRTRLGAETCERIRACMVPIQEYDTDLAVLSEPAASLKGSLIIVSRPHDGWIFKADHGGLSTRPNEYYIHPVRGCRFSCSYCYLQATPLGRLPLRFHVDFQDLLSCILRRVGEEDGKVLFSSGETADSLADQDIFPVTRDLIRAFATISGASLELRTKSDDVDALCALTHNRNSTISFSLMPQAYVTKYDHGTPSVDRRLEAASKLLRSGYPVAINLEPLLLGPDWRILYEDLARKIHLALGTSIEHIAVGSLRWSKSLESVPVFSRDYRDLLARGTTIEYRPGRFNGTLQSEERLGAYKWILGSFKRQGLGDIKVLWSMEESSIIDTLNSGAPE